ncbi:MAG: hypothetical protein ACOVQ7_25155 [Limnoraphis robusta]|jgi:hypothetical protein
MGQGLGSILLQVILNNKEIVWGRKVSESTENKIYCGRVWKIIKNNSE